MRSIASDCIDQLNTCDARSFRQLYPLIVASGYTLARANAVPSAGEQANFVAFGQLFLDNSDLVERFRRAAPQMGIVIIRSWMQCEQSVSPDR